MKLKNTLIVVKDINKAKQFYQQFYIHRAWRLFIVMSLLCRYGAEMTQNEGESQQ